MRLELWLYFWEVSDIYSVVDVENLLGILYRLFECTNFVQNDFSSPLVGADHNPVCVSIGTWALPPLSGA